MPLLVFQSMIFYKVLNNTMTTIKFLILFVCLGTISFSQVQTNDTKVIYDSKGNKFGEGIYRYNKQEGKWIYYFSNGRKMAEGNFQSGDGTDIGSNGIPRNGRVGKWYTYYENGTLKQESNFVNGKLNGIYKSYYESGSIKGDGYYVDDKQDGKWIIYFSNGRKMAEGNYQSGDGTDLGATGIPRNGRVGKWYTYYEKNGFLEQQSNYINGKLNGIFKSYYENGTLQEESNFVNGKLNGIAKTYYENGSIKGEENYVDDKLNGITKTYYESGKQKEYRTYVDGKLNGIYKIYYENGNLKQESNTINNEYNGITKVYNANGSLDREENYVNGDLQSSKTISQTNTNTNSSTSNTKNKEITGKLKENQYRGRGIRLIKTAEDHYTVKIENEDKSISTKYIIFKKESSTPFHYIYSERNSTNYFEVSFGGMSIYYYNEFGSLIWSKGDIWKD